MTKCRLHDRKTENLKALSKCSISTGHSIYLHDQKISLYCEIKKTPFIRDLQPALNETFFREKRFLCELGFFLISLPFTLTTKRSLPRMYVV